MSSANTMTADEKVANLEAYIAEGRTVFFQTALRTWKVDAACVARFAEIGAKVFKAKNGSLWLANGKRFVCADGCRITVR